MNWQSVRLYSVMITVSTFEIVQYIVLLTSNNSIWKKYFLQVALLYDKQSNPFQIPHLLQDTIAE